MAWAPQTIDEATAEHHQMLRTYTRWVLLRRASRDSSGDIAVGAARHVKASLRGLVTFLAWVQEQQTPLRSLTQAYIEEFITLRTARRWLPQFLAWAAEHEEVIRILAYDPQYLNRRLRPLGATISELQNTARFRLAGAVPAKVLADMLDFSVATFENYARLSGSTRGDYPALRGMTPQTSGKMDA